MKRHLHPKLLAVVLALCAPLACTATPPSAVPGQAAPPPTTPPVFTLAATVTDQPENPADKGVASRITKVTVYSDRALVTREAAVALTTEPAVLRFKNLPGWVDEGSVRASSSAGKIVDVTVDRRFLARSNDDGFRKAELKHKALLQKVQALDDELGILNAQQQHVEDRKSVV